MKYEVTVEQVGSVTVEANSREEAMSKVNSFCSTTDIQWDDTFMATDAYETED